MLFITALDYLMRRTDATDANIRIVAEEILRDLAFADDVVLFDSSAERAAWHTKALGEFSGEIGLHINCSKTQAMFVTTNAVPLTVDDKQIDPVDDFRYLGSMVSG